jgi:hypothetical protein
LGTYWNPILKSGDVLEKTIFKICPLKKNQKNSNFIFLEKKKVTNWRESTKKNNNTDGFKLTKRVQIKVWRRPMDLTPFVLAG